MHTIYKGVTLMIIYTTKLTKKKAVAILVSLALLIAAVILIMPDKKAAGEPVFSAQQTVTSEADMAAYIRDLGYETDGEVLESREVTIPKEFDDVYEAYNDMQKECGFDLEKYRGRRVMLYTYAITRYPGCEDEVRCDMHVCRKKLIGGNIYTVAVDGFMHGLTAPQQG